MKNIHYIPHTHWDREWYRSAEGFRLRLVYAMDRLLNILDENPEYKFFTYDGQTSVLEDYLAIRPENRERLVKYISEKRILVGPWYIQPDLYLVSGESILRNLVIGSNIAKEFGNCMQVGWIPDAFGQIQSVPQIFKELGMKAVFVWRGFDHRKTNDSVFLWEAPNGEKLLTVHFPLGYAHHRYLPSDKDQAIKEVEEAVLKAEKRLSDDQILFMGGTDHAVARYDTLDILDSIRGYFEEKGYNIKLSNPELFIQDVLDHQKESGREMQTYKGEARSADLGRIHAGISSTRIDIKNAMKDYETKLPLVIEPMSVLNSLFGGSFNQAITNFFWKTLFKNQFHDSIYSSSPETVNNAVENRLLNLRHGLNELIWMNCRFLKDKVDLSGLKDGDQPVVIFNTLPYKRNDLIFINLYVKNDNFSLRDLDNNEIEFVRIENIEKINSEIEYYNGIVNLNDPSEVLEGTMKQVQLKIKADILPALGYKVLKICYGESPKLVSTSDLKLDAESRVIENKYLKVSINEDGTIDVLNKQNNKLYKDLAYFEDKGDEGDEYNYSPPTKDVIITTKGAKADINLVESNPLFVKYEIIHSINAPYECIGSARSEDTKTFNIINEVTLESESKTIKFKTRIANNNKDHMVRVVFTDIYESNESLSEDHFGTIVRGNKVLNAKGIENGATEIELPIYPMQGFVKLNHNDSTFVVLSKGPCEYEIYDNKAIALTILRSVGYFGKADLNTRPGRASGYKLEAPSSQLLKEVTSEYSIYFDEKATLSDISKETLKLKVDMMTRHLKDFSRDVNDGLKGEFSLIEADNRVDIMALKKLEKGTDLVLRVKNTNDYDIENVYIKLNPMIKGVHNATLTEEKLDAVDISNGEINIAKIGKNSFMTFILNV